MSSAPMRDVPNDLHSLLAATREHLIWEAELDGMGIPVPVPAARPAPAGRPPAAPVPPASGEVARLAVRPPGGGPRLEILSELAREAATCTLCVLHAGRTKSVFSRGSPDARVVFVGEGPGYHEDQRGEPFVGPAGQLLDKMIVAMGYGRDDVYVCNVVKCRPPENRTPLPPEMDACSRYLVPQIEAIAPEAIVALGRCAAEALGCVPPAGPWRGVWSAWRGVPVMPTYHPAFLLRSPQFKRQVWDDLKKVMARLGNPVP